jgi:RimJ/RimL family protein N-acetyltransferase
VLYGDRVALRPFELDDVARLQVWLDDPDVRLGWDDEEATRSRADLERELRPAITGEDQDTRWFVIQEDDAPVGALHLHLSEHHRNAEIDILIGEGAARDRGLGSDAIGTIMRYVFDELACHRLWLITSINNPRAIRCYEKCGLQREGVLREAGFQAGAPVDGVVMSILEREWRER